MLFRVNKKYKVGKRLGSGAFGEIYQGIDMFTGEEVAIKVESVAADHPQLRHEYKVYRLLNGVGSLRNTVIIFFKQNTGEIIGTICCVVYGNRWCADGSILWH